MRFQRWWHRISKEIFPTRGIRPAPRVFLPRLPVRVLVLVFIVASILIGIALVEKRLRPIVRTVAQTQAASRFTETVDEAILADLLKRDTGYEDFITIQRGSDGNIQALVTNMADMNFLQASIEDHVYEVLGDVDASEISVPVGSLTGLDLLWGRGPSLHAHSLSMGVLNSEFISDFSSAGINQTRHRIYLDLQIPLTVLLAGVTVETQLTTHLCVAETVIVGNVPNSFLQF